MNIVVLLFLQCGTNHRDCFQSAYCESSIGHSAGYESEALFYHSAKDRASASDWMLLCVIIQKRTARTSVLIYLLILFVPRMTHEALQLKNPLTTVASNNLCPSQILQCHSSFSFFFSGALWASSGALWASSRVFPQYLSPNQNSSDILSVIPLETRPIHFQRLPLFVLDSGIVAVFSYSCLFDILSGNCSSRFSEGIFDGTPQASHIFRWFSGVQSSKVTLP